MKVLKQLFSFYIQSSIHVALTICALTIITFIEYDIEYYATLIYVVFFASIVGYNFVKYFGLAKFHYRSLTKRLKTIQLLTLFSFCLTGFFSIYLPVKLLVYVVFFGVINIFYAIPFLPKRFLLDINHNLRSISGLKVYVIAFVWTGVTVFIPIKYANISIDFDVCLSLFQRFLFIILLILPFEIRDLNFDSLKLSTIPQKIGVKYTKLLGILISVTIVMLEVLKDSKINEKQFVLIIILIISSLFLVNAKIKQGSYYSAFWVESIPILWLLLLMFS